MRNDQAEEATIHLLIDVHINVSEKLCFTHKMFLACGRSLLRNNAKRNEYGRQLRFNLFGRLWSVCVWQITTTYRHSRSIPTVLEWKATQNR